MLRSYIDTGKECKVGFRAKGSIGIQEKYKFFICVSVKKTDVLLQQNCRDKGKRPGLSLYGIHGDTPGQEVRCLCVCVFVVGGWEGGGRGVLGKGTNTTTMQS
jgi:hypothetical protein